MLNETFNLRFSNTDGGLYHFRARGASGCKAVQGGARRCSLVGAENSDKIKIRQFRKFGQDWTIRTKMDISENSDKIEQFRKFG